MRSSFLVLKDKGFTRPLRMPSERDPIFIANLPLALILLEVRNWRKVCLDENREVLTLLSPMNMEAIVNINPGPSAGHGLYEAHIGIVVH